jgi:hypothetical protein
MKNNYNTNKIEQFANYNDIKTKTINWCTKMRDQGLLSPAQYDNCISSFSGTNSGTLPKGIDIPPSGMPLNYSLYNTRSEKLSSNLSTEDTNTFMIMTNTGQYMACDSKHNVYYIKDINNPDTNQDELYFTLLAQSDDVYSLMSSYGNYLIANMNWGADFSGTSMGKMASWNITKVNDNIILESVQYTGFFLSFTNDKTPLSIIYGKDDTTQWKLFPKSQTNPNDKYGDYQGGDYISQQITILSDIKNNAIAISVLNKNKNGLVKLQNNIRSNYSKIVAYMQSQLEYQKKLYDLKQANSKRKSASASGSGTKVTDSSNESQSVTSSGLKLSNTDIGKIIINISNMESYYLNLIEAEISNIDTQLNAINLQESINKYDVLITDMKKKLAQTLLNIQQNNLIMGRQQDNYEQIDDDKTYIQKKNENYEKLNSSLKLNLDIVNGNLSQTSYLLKIYPFIILILALCLIYLSYITIIKFKKNIASKY